MMRGIRRLIAYTATTGLLVAGAVSASLQVAQADTPGNFAAACGGNAENTYHCNMDTTINSAGSITATVDSGSASEGVNVNWTVTCADSTGSRSEEGATEAGSTPLTVPLAPLPPTAADGACQVNVGMTLPTHVITPKVAFTGELDFTPASSSPGTNHPPAVHPVIGFDGKCADVKGNSSANGAKVEIWTCSGSDQAESWKSSNGELVHNGKCLNDQRGGDKGSKVILYTCNRAPNEIWTHLANGEFVLKARGGKLCLDDPASSTRNGTQLIVWTCKNVANQHWSLP
jgi:hypothetical protein